ncbi:MAG: dihydrolipoyl dehydrogenase [Candidatus Krumholzibacteriota bacterium]|nr:dihydrolipoyl dehydrogenase [Candidatus Krumholzibacteriota bacterium]
MAAEYDLVVIGGGPAGYPAAIRASQMGANVCLVEREKLGGVCLNWGCIPTKTLHAAAHLIEQAGEGSKTGLKGSLKVDLEGLLSHKKAVIDNLVSGVEKLLKKRGINVVKGRAEIVGAGEVYIEETGSIRGKKLIIATGSSEIALPGMEFDGQRVISSKDILNLNKLPESLLIIGGGVIGCEFASILNAFGCGITIVEMLPSLISGEDRKVSRFLKAFLRRKGVVTHLGRKVESLHRGNKSVTAHLDNGTEIESESVLVSVGRTPNIDNIGLENLGVGMDKSGIEVNRRMETSVNGVFAAGDVAGGMLLAHVATREGIVAAENALGRNTEIDYSLVPSTIYTLPEIAHVGLTEEEAADRNIEIITGNFPFSANGKAQGLREKDGFVKWIAEKSSGKLRGLHIIGPQATELISVGIIALERGMKSDDFERVVIPHPTLSESISEAADDINDRAINIY